MHQLLVIGVLALAAAVAGLQLLARRGRRLLRDEDMERLLAALEFNPLRSSAEDQLLPEPRRRPAPDFALPDARDGTLVCLSDLRGRRPVILFFDPKCERCRTLAPEMEALHQRLASGGGAGLVVVSRGSRRALLRRARRFGWSFALPMQRGWEIANRYGSRAVPIAFVLDDENRMAREVVAGVAPILALAGSPQAPRPASWPSKDLSKSLILRDGLPSGTVAPSFDLAGLDGGRVRLADFRGQPTLVVFSDSQCGPCFGELAPALQRELDAARPGDPAVVMVSRGDPELNRLRARELGLSFPIGLQEGWRTSKEYGLFATPAAFLIDELGRTWRDVAVGVPAILTLWTHGQLSRREVSPIAKSQP